MRLILLGLLCIAPPLAAPLPALELEIRFPLLEKQLSDALFTQDGRRYVRGTPKTRCNYAFLANPRFSSRDGQLLIRARFSGRSSVDVFGKCLGMGDSFDFEVLAGLATNSKGALNVTNPKVTLLGATSLYAKRVRAELEKSIGDAIQYPIRDEMRKLLAAASQSSPYKITVGKVEIRSLSIEPNSLIVDVDTRFVVE
jgi:hypothetical protein